MIKKPSNLSVLALAGQDTTPLLRYHQKVRLASCHLSFTYIPLQNKMTRDVNVSTEYDCAQPLTVDNHELITMITTGKKLQWEWEVLITFVIRH